MQTIDEINESVVISENAAIVNRKMRIISHWEDIVGKLRHKTDRHKNSYVLDEGLFNGLLGAPKTKEEEAAAAYRRASHNWRRASFDVAVDKEMSALARDSQ